MSSDPALLELMGDEITIEPYASNSATQAATYGAAVTYQAQVIAEWRKTIDRNGRELKSNVRVLIPERIHVDPRDRLTLPEGWIPRQPPIISVSPVGGALGIDSTEVLA